MSTELWFFVVGCLLLAMGVGARALRRLPITPALVYLVVGLVAGPSGFALFHFNPLKESALLEILAEIAVLISLFAAGVKMPVPFSFPRWRQPILLATVAMAATVGLVAAFVHVVLGLSLGASVLLGAILAPTDPVLATDVQVRHPGDGDALRFTLTSEAGMNDGTAFPFVVLGLGLLGLHDLGENGVRWLVFDVAWATAAGIGIGIAGGWALAHVGWRARGRRRPNRPLLDDFLGLGLIAAVYGLTLIVDGWGFLAVFFAAVALRQTELKLADAPARSRRLAARPDAGMGAPEAIEPDPEQTPTVSRGSLVFKEHLERLSELMLVTLLGGSLFLDSWTLRAVALAAFVFVIARPVGVAMALAGSGCPPRMNALLGWFGVRGIGSMYYLMYAIEHGLPEPEALQVLQLTLVVVTLSIVVHGVSVKPLMLRYWLRRRPRR